MFLSDTKQLELFVWDEERLQTGRTSGPQQNPSGREGSSVFEQ